MRAWPSQRIMAVRAVPVPVEGLNGLWASDDTLAPPRHRRGSVAGRCGGTGGSLFRILAINFA